MSASSTPPRPSAEAAGCRQLRPAPPQFKGKYLSLATCKQDGTRRHRRRWPASSRRLRSWPCSALAFCRIGFLADLGVDGVVQLPEQLGKLGPIAG